MKFGIKSWDSLMEPQPISSYSQDPSGLSSDVVTKMFSEQGKRAVMMGTTGAGDSIMARKRFRGLD
jgi:hypothetical protein